MPSSFTGTLAYAWMSSVVPVSIDWRNGCICMCLTDFAGSVEEEHSRCTKCDGQWDVLRHTECVCALDDRG